MSEVKTEVINGKPVKHIDCRFATFIPHPEERNDMHFVKEHITFEDGSTMARLKARENFKRPFYITRKGMRNHEQKKEFEKRQHVETYFSTQSELKYAVAKALGTFASKRTTMRDLAESPYLYGTDMLSTTYLKKEYRKRWGDVQSVFNVAVMDTETDVVNGTEEVIMITLSFRDRIFTGVVKQFVDGVADVENRCRKLADKLLGDILKERGVNWELQFYDTSADAIEAAFARAHDWKPDFITFWNMLFDMQKIEEALNKHGRDIAAVISDPSVPRDYQFYHLEVGPRTKVSEKGIKITLEPSDRWHVVTAPATFYLIDSMCVYRKLRIADGKDPSYSLDAILEKHKIPQKLKFDATSHLDGLAWHVEMQKYYKVEYIVYNIYDCISVELLDEKVKDLQIAVPSQCGVSDFMLFPSQPKRLCDGISGFVANKYDYVWGTTSSKMRHEYDLITTSNEGWILTLDATLVANNGLACIKEFPGLRTNIRTHFGDLDVSASYPTNGSVFNVSRYTTVKEFAGIKGRPEQLVRLQGLNLSGGKTNAVEFCNMIYRLPTLDQLYTDFVKHLETGDTSAEYSF